MNASRGITLLETLVWIGIFIMAMLALVSSVLYFYRSSNYAIQLTSATASAQRGIDQMIKVMRTAAYASNGAYPIVSFGTHDVRFFANVDSDPGIERVRYYVSGTSLYRGTVEPTGDPAIYTGAESSSVVSEYVRNLDATIGTTTFKYFNSSGNEITDYTQIGSVRFITTTLLIDVDQSKSPTPLTLRSSAALRNLVGH